MDLGKYVWAHEAENAQGKSDPKESYKADLIVNDWSYVVVDGTDYLD